jgi:L-malate glycosyltransferase
MKKKIMFLHRGDSPYDEIVLRTITEIFSVTYVTFNPKPSINLHNSGLVILKSPLSFLYNNVKARFLIYAIANPELKRILNREKPDLLIGSYCSTYGFMAAKTGFHPLVLIAFGSDILMDSKNFLLRRRVKLALSKADLIVADSDAVETGITKLGFEGKNIIKFPRFDSILVSNIPKTDSSSSFKSRHRITDKKMILHTRWFEPVYNVETVVRAFALVNEKIHNTFLVLAGEGQEELSIKALVKKLNLSDCVYFTGKLAREELIRLNDEANVYVSASLSDGSSSSLLEAMCRGTPVVVSDSDANKEWIKDGVSGTLFNALSPAELAHKIISVLAEPEKCRIMADRAKAEVLARANWSKNVAILIEKIPRLLSES